MVRAPAWLFKTGKKASIRYWLRGRIQQRGREIKVTLILTDTKEQHNERWTTLTLDLLDQLIGFYKVFLAWLKTCCLPLPDARVRKALWPEKTNPEGLDLLGRERRSIFIHRGVKKTCSTTIGSIGAHFRSPCFFPGRWTKRRDPV